MPEWTQKDIEILTEMHGKYNVSDISDALGRTYKAVCNQITRQNLSKKAYWTEEQKEAVRKEYERVGQKKIDLKSLAEELGMSRSRVCAMARDMGLTDKCRMKTETGPKDVRKFKGDKRALSAHMSRKAKERFADGNHPKGMAGKRHSNETKRAIGKMSAERWRNMTQEQRFQQTQKGVNTRKEKGFSTPAHKRGTWRAGWRQVGSKRIYFRSRWEANYAFYLNWLQQKGEIIEWEYEPKTFWFEEIRRGVRSYKPDFWVVENSGKGKFHEVKGWMCPRSKTTLRRMAKYYPDQSVALTERRAAVGLNSAAQSFSQADLRATCDRLYARVKAGGKGVSEARRALLRAKTKLLELEVRGHE